MGKSFLLKDSEGRAAGYLQIRSDEIRCRAKSSQPALLVLFGMRDRKWQFDLQPGGKEQCFSIAEAEILGAVVARAGVVYLATDDTARQMYAHGMCGANAEKAEQKDRSNAEREKEKEPKEERKTTSVEQMHAAWPQRRWPPPACCPHAVYQRGIWCAEDEAALCFL